MTDIAARSAAAGGTGAIDCPACRAPLDSPADLFSMRDVPVQSCVLRNDLDTARAFPTGDVDLVHCPRCALVFNRSFDPDSQRFAADYEETQGFSGTFRAYARSLARELVERFEILGRHVVEIGCGKGEFLKLVCETGSNRGTGFDPAWVPGRLELPDPIDIDFRREMYTAGQLAADAGVVICRHTLEHIADCRRFVDSIRGDIGVSDTLVLFDVPARERILAEGAFWDIYYEHCNYFDATSLRRLFETAGFEIIELRHDFIGQYLTLFARPAGRHDPGACTAGAEPAPEANRLTGQLRRWQRRLDDARASNRRLALWGGGSKAVAFVTGLEGTDCVDCIVDINPHKQGRYLPGSGHPVVAPQALIGRRIDEIIVMNPAYLEEIGALAGQLGIGARLVTVTGSSP